MILDEIKIIWKYLNNFFNFFLLVVDNNFNNNKEKIQ